MTRNPDAEALGQTPTEYARNHGLTLDWVYRLIRTGRLPHVRKFGRFFITGEPAKAKVSRKA